ncbi:MAG: PIN domain-containing protein [Acidobacteriaceae bacterium]
MLTYALDSSAILRFLENEAGSDRIEAIFQNQIQGKAIVIISALHWGEVAGYAYRTRGQLAVDMVLQRLLELHIEVVPVTAEQAVSAALIRATHRIPYVDAFGAVLASAAHHVFVTADFDLKPAAKSAKIEFLPAK